jgi:aryl-alcohol dehydrogenase-like predicted oxidoreductase
MEYRTLGRTGIRVNPLGLGTMVLGPWGNTDIEACRRVVSRALDAGINLVDTADTYGDGATEEIIGPALRGRRGDVVLATKFQNPVGDHNDPNRQGNSRRWMMRAVEDSLRRLGTDWIDIYYIHHVDVETELDEMLYAVDALVRQGKVRYPACSNYEAWRLSEALWLSDHAGLARFECYQPQYSLVVRDIELELLPLCSYKRLGVAVWAPLAGGFLSGSYRPGMQVREGSRSADGWAYPGRFFAPSADATLRLLLERAPQTGRTPAQVALRWVVQRPGITSAIVGARDATQLAENLGAAGWRLEAELAQALTTVSEPAPRYPQAMEREMVERRAEAVVAPGRQGGQA